ncbi:hypothetical protein DIC66_01800 [Rhodoferax lacus]|uniref:Uncharacterized protein n=1 Tax=Rhodoferax lacus TaxID=2184758 RepID=A0A3E1RH08_9BURK|nr:hypothetical protein [Rhodoferax lacus]RFO98644.1 hypothetical protein DIC66_01800 [Rhodoferax lacus]
MALITWIETPHTRTALLGDVPVCTIKVKDIGGCTALWLNGMLWPAPAHMPKAPMQSGCFFSSVADAKLAIELQLNKLSS